MVREEGFEVALKRYPKAPSTSRATESFSDECEYNDIPRNIVITEQSSRGEIPGKITKGSRSRTVSPSRVSKESAVTINHKISNKNQNERSIVGLIISKPILMAGAAYAVVATGAMGYFLSEYFTIPGLDRQVGEFEDENGRLELLNGELKNLTTDLEEENYQLSREVDRLNDTILNMEVQNRIFNDSVKHFPNLTASLNSTNMEYKELNQNLTESLVQAEAQNDILQDQIQNLTSIVTSLQNESSTFQTLLKESELQVETLNDQSSKLGRANTVLNLRIDSLSAQVNDLIEENDQLANHINDLERIVTWLNDTGLELLGQSVEDIANFLVGEIDQNQGLLLGRVEETFKQRVGDYSCNLRQRFGGRIWQIDVSVSIGEEDYGTVMHWTEEVLLTEVCVDIDDFETFLSTHKEIGYSGAIVDGSPVNITADQLMFGEEIYMGQLMDYYFPDRGETGLTMDDWADASFTCEKLPTQKRFVYGVSK